MVGGDDEDIRCLVDRLRRAEEAFEWADGEFVRLRNTVDLAGELALWERLEWADRALQEAIGQLDEVVYPVGQTWGRD